MASYLDPSRRRINPQVGQPQRPQAGTPRSSLQSTLQRNRSQSPGTVGRQTRGLTGTTDPSQAEGLIDREERRQQGTEQPGVAPLYQGRQTPPRQDAGGMTTTNFLQGSLAGGYGNLESNRDRMLREYLLSGRREAPTTQAAWMDARPQHQFRQQQMGLAQSLQAQAAGQMPSVAEMQLRQGQDRAMAQQLAAASSARGVSPALAMRQAMQNQAAIGQQTNAQAAQLRAGETMAAQQALGGLLGQGRQQDIGLAQTQAGIQQQVNLANQQARMQQQQINDAQQRSMMGMATQQDIALLNSAAGISAAQQGGASGMQQALGTGLAVAGTAAAMMSDERMKMNVGSTSGNYLENETMPEMGDTPEDTERKRRLALAGRMMAGQGMQMVMSDEEAKQNAYRQGLGRGAGMAVQALRGKPAPTQAPQGQARGPYAGTGLAALDPSQDVEGSRQQLVSLYAQRNPSAVVPPREMGEPTYVRLPPGSTDIVADPQTGLPNPIRVEQLRTRDIEEPRDVNRAIRDWFKQPGSPRPIRAEQPRRPQANIDRSKSKDEGKKVSRDFLEALSAERYAYKNDPSRQPHLGVMAQDLGKSEAGRRLLRVGPDGNLMVDYNQAGPPMLASLADLNERVKKVEKKR